MENNLALVGCYYFRRAEDLIGAIEEQMERDIRLKEEFFLADAIDIMLEHGARIRVDKTETWLDTGTMKCRSRPDRYLLKRDGGERPPRRQQPATGQAARRQGARAGLHPQDGRDHPIRRSGPCLPIGANCRISGSVIEDSIVESDCEISDISLRRSVVGRQAKVQGRGTKAVLTLNISDNSSVIAG